MKKLIVIIVVVVIGVFVWYSLGTKSESIQTTEEAIDTVVETGEIVVLDVTGKNFEFSMTEIRVSEGDTVTINFESTEGFHDWVIDEFAAGTERVVEGDKSSVTFVASRTGVFEFYCSVGNHRAQGMVGTLIVE